MIRLIVAVFPLDLDLVGEVFRVVPDSPDEARPATQPCGARDGRAVDTLGVCHAGLCQFIAKLFTTQ